MQLMSTLYFSIHMHFSEQFYNINELSIMYRNNGPEFPKIFDNCHQAH